MEWFSGGISSLSGGGNTPCRAYVGVARILRSKLEIGASAIDTARQGQSSSYTYDGKDLKVVVPGGFDDSSSVLDIGSPLGVRVAKH